MAGRGDRGATRRGGAGVPNMRGERTRRRIAEATLALLVESESPPTAHDIADRAGVSHRLIFHHFEDLNALHFSLGSVYVDRFGKLAPKVSPDLPLDRRIQRTVQLRATLYESIGNLGFNATALAPNHPGVAAAVRNVQQMFMDFIGETFAPELGQVPGRARRRELLAALDASASWAVWDRLRRVNGLPVASSRRVMTHMLHGAITHVR